MPYSDFLTRPALPRPDVTASDAITVALEVFGVSGTITELGSHQDRNFLVDTGGRLFVLKFSNPAFATDELEAQDAAAAAARTSGLATPSAVSSREGRTIEIVNLRGADLPVRMLDWVDGEPLTGAGPLPAGAARALGATAARVARALADVEHPGADRVTQWNLRIADQVVELLLPFVADAHRERVAALATSAGATIAPVRDALRVQVIHGDISDDNVVASGDEITGVIDFGDVANSWTIAELAVACAAVLHHDPRDPLAVLEVIAGFAEVLPLTDPELRALWPLVQLRAAVLVASGEQQVALDGAGNRYADQNRRHEWLAFAAAEGLDAEAMHSLIRWRLGDRAEPVELAPPAVPLLDTSNAAFLDLSTTSDLLDAGVWLEEGAESRLADTLAAEAGAAVTAWGEARLTRTEVLSSNEVPTVPLGCDVTAAAGTEVSAPVSGNLRHAEGAVVLETDSWDLWISGLDPIAAQGPIEAGALLGRFASHPESSFGRLTVQISRLTDDRPPFFVRPSEAPV